MTSYMTPEMQEVVNRPNQTFNPIAVEPGATTWYLPVAGMRAKPGDVSEGGNWAEGSFGYRKPASKGGHIHDGVDIYAKAGTAIIAPVAGTVTSVGKNNAGGFYVRLRGTDGIDYYFAHMQSASPWTKGTKIQAGIFLGSVGNSGNAAGTSPHLHFSMKKNGRAVKPNDFLRTGRQQTHTPLSSIPGLNTPEEVQRWAQQEAERQRAANQAMQGFEAGAIPGMIAEGQVTDSPAFGQQFLGSTLNAFSKKIAGGQRTPIPRLSATPNSSTATRAVEGGGTAMQGVPQEQMSIDQMRQGAPDATG